MELEQGSAVFKCAQTTLKEIKIKIQELSNSDLSSVHVNHEWSWIPYLKDHLEFLIEQIGGLETSLRDGPPPVSDEDLKKLSEFKTQNEC